MKNTEQTESLASWSLEMSQNIQDFMIHWLENNKSNPDQFPTELFSGEWDEQFKIFLEVNRF